MLLRCITIPVFAVTSSAKLLHRHRRESAACRVVQRRAGDVFSLARPMSWGGARGTVLGACCWHLSQPCCAKTRQRHWAAVKESKQMGKSPVEILQWVPSLYLITGGWIENHCFPSELSESSVVWQLVVQRAVTPQASRVYAVTHTEYHWHPAQ